MHPTIHCHLMQARIAGLYHQATSGRLSASGTTDIRRFWGNGGRPWPR